MGNGRRDIAVRDRVIRGETRDIADKRRDINRSADAPRRVMSCRVTVTSRPVVAAGTKRERADLRVVDLRWTVATRRTVAGVFTYTTKTRFPQGFALKIPPLALALYRHCCGTAWYHLTNTCREPRAVPPSLLRSFVVQPNTNPPRRAHARHAYPGTSDARRSDETDAMGRTNEEERVRESPSSRPRRTRRLAALGRKNRVAALAALTTVATFTSGVLGKPSELGTISHGTGACRSTVRYTLSCARALRH